MFVDLAVELASRAGEVGGIVAVEGAGNSTAGVVLQAVRRNRWQSRKIGIGKSKRPVFSLPIVVILRNVWLVIMNPRPEWQLSIVGIEGKKALARL